VSLITESQNHRMFGVGRDLCGSSSPTPLAKQGDLQQGAQDFVSIVSRRICSICGTSMTSLNYCGLQK